MAPATLTPKQTAFVHEYLVDLNATQAALRAGYSKKTAFRIGSENLQKPEIAAALQDAMAKRAKRTAITADNVLRELWAIATADPRELVEYRRTCCRYCHGEGFGYQMTPKEFAKREQDERDVWERRKSKKPTDVFAFDELGGVGFDANRAPNAACPECFGHGVERMHVADTRNLSDTARALYAGVKQTKDGLEVKMLDRQAALLTVGKHLGMFVDKVETRDLSFEDAMRKRHERRLAGTGA